MARNREAYHEYFVEEEFEAGIELVGTEVKSIRAGTLNLSNERHSTPLILYHLAEICLSVGVQLLTTTAFYQDKL